MVIGDCMIFALCLDMLHLEGGLEVVESSGKSLEKLALELGEALASQAIHQRHGPLQFLDHQNDFNCQPL